MHPRHKPFTIGLAPLDLADWIEVDDRLGDYLAEKNRLHAACFDTVFVAEPDTIAAQREVLDLLSAYLPERFPDIYTRSGNSIAFARDLSAPAKRQGDPPLLRAASLVQEDLVIMRRNVNGWRLVAASVCFPSSWSLENKFGLPLDDIHAPVPDFGPGSRNAAMISRIFDNLKVDRPVERFNWSLYSNAELHQPDHNAEQHFDGVTDITGFYLRIERQTLRKLPQSGDILFTIRIHLDPVTALKSRPEAIRPFIEHLRGLSTRQLDYKGLLARRERIFKALAVSER